MVTALAVAGAVVLLILGIPYLAQHSQRSSGTGSASGSSGPLGVFDEIFNPGAHRSQVVIEQLKERKSPTRRASGDAPTEAPIPGADENDDEQAQKQ